MLTVSRARATHPTSAAAFAIITGSKAYVWAESAGWFALPRLHGGDDAATVALDVGSLSPDGFYLTYRFRANHRKSSDRSKKLARYEISTGLLATEPFPLIRRYPAHGSSSTLRVEGGHYGANGTVIPQTFTLQDFELGSSRPLNLTESTREALSGNLAGPNIQFSLPGDRLVASLSTSDRDDVVVDADLSENVIRRYPGWVLHGTASLNPSRSLCLVRSRISQRLAVLNLATGDALQLFSTLPPATEVAGWVDDNVLLTHGRSGNRALVGRLSISTQRTDIILDLPSPRQEGDEPVLLLAPRIVQEANFSLLTRSR